MTTNTFTWTGTGWNPPSPPPAPGDTLIIPAGSTVPASGTLSGFIINIAGPGTTLNFAGAVSSSNTMTATGSGVVWNGTTSSMTGDVYVFDTADTVNLVDSTITSSKLTFANGDTLNLTGSANGTMVIDPNNPSTQTIIHETGTGAAVTINASGIVTNEGMVWLDSPGNVTTLNIKQNGTVNGLYDSENAVIEAGGTLIVNGSTTAGAAMLDNAKFLFSWGGTGSSLVQINAQMDGHGGQMNILGGANTATLELATNTSGAQAIVFDDARGTLKIDTTTTLPGGGKTLANTKSRILGFTTGDTIDLAGLAPTGLTYKYGTDAYYGPGVLELFSSGSLVGALRFGGSQFTTGNGTYGGTFGSNFVLADDGAGGTKITLQSTTINSGTVASWVGSTNGDWSSTSLWASGEGTGGVPGTYQTAEFAMTPAEAAAAQSGSMTKYTITVNGPAAAGSVVFADPFDTLQINNALTVAALGTTESGGGSFLQTSGTVDITSGGTLTANNYYQVDDKLFVEAGGTLKLAGQIAFAQNIGLQALDIENDGTVSGGKITAAGAINVGQKAQASVWVGANSSVTGTYTMIGGSNYGSTDTLMSTSQLNISGANALWSDIGGDTLTPYSGAMLIGGGNPGVGNTTTVISGNTVYPTSVPNGGTGALWVDSGATLNDASYAMLGLTVGSFGTANVTNSAQWLIGTSTIAPPSSIVIGTSTIANTTTGTVAGLTVGNGGSGTLFISTGGTVKLGTVESASSFKVSIGQGGSSSTSAFGMVQVSGLNSLLDTGGGPMAIGNRGTGMLMVQSGGTVVTGNGGSITGMSFGAVLGNKNTNGVASVGTLSVMGFTGQSGLFTVQSGDLVIGRDGRGTAFITQYGSVSVAGNIFLGGTGTGGGLGLGSGTLNVWGGTVQAARLWSLHNTTTLAPSSIGIIGGGVSGGGIVSLAASGTLSAAFNLDGGSASITNSGSLLLDASGTATIGGGTTLTLMSGVMQFASSYTGTGYRLSIGDTLGTGNVVVYSAGARIDTAGPISIGQGNSGTLAVSQWGTVTAGTVGSVAPWSAVVGNSASGVLAVGGGGGGNAAFNTTGALVVGLNSYGALQVWQGGMVNVGGELDVGGSPLTSGSGGTGSVTIDGGGTLYNAAVVVAGSIVVGASTLVGTNSIQVQNGASLNAGGAAYLGTAVQSGTLAVTAASGFLNMTGGGIGQVAGLYMWQGSNVFVDTSSWLAVGAAGSPGAGNIGIASGATLAGEGTITTSGTFVDNGLIMSGLPNVGVPGSNILNLYGAVTGNGTLSITGGTTLEVGAVANTDTIVFTTGTGEILGLKAPAPMLGNIINFYSVGSPTIDLLGVSSTGLTWGWNQTSSAGGILTITPTSGPAVATLNVRGWHPGGFTLGSDGVGGTSIVANDAPCFAAGTRFVTARGEVAVEQLRVGDTVRLASGGTAPVRWLGHRTVDCAAHPRPHDVRPVRVAAHAFGAGQPSRDLLLSPDHAVFIDGVLIPVRYLLNGATIVQEAARRVTYWHVELDQHDVLLAEGLACESYLDTGNRGAFANGGGAVMMHPDFALGVWNRAACARLVWEGAELEAARSYLLERARGLGFSLTDDPDLHVLVDGRRLEAQSVAGGLHRFVLPGDAEAVVIASRAAVPAEIHDLHPDGRRLGVMLAHISFRQDGRTHRVGLDSLPDGAGFYAFEQADGQGWRWTDGHACVPVPAGFAPDRDLVLDLQVTASLPAWIAPTCQSSEANGRSAAA